MIGLAGILILAVISTNHFGNRQPQHATVTKPVSKKNRLVPLTLTDFNRHPKLAYGGIIYYAVKHGKIQRWQEVSDFNLGWQIEVHRTQMGKRYFVWPDKHIKNAEKRLEPNWFAFKSGNRVVYHSFVVHSFRKNLTQTTTRSHIVKQINADGAETKVREMVERMAVITDN